MRQCTLVLLLLGVGVAASGCASPVRTPVERASSSRMDLITREEIDKQHWANAYDLVATLRPRWLNERGPDSFATPPELQVHYNGTRAGGVNVLKQMVLSEVEYLEYIDPLTATARWGIGYGHGAIDISTKPKS